MEGAVALSISTPSQQHVPPVVRTSMFLVFLTCLLQIYYVSSAAVGSVPYGSTRDRGIAPWQFDEPIGLALAPDGTLLVADSYNNRIQACKDGFCKTVAGGNGRGNASNQLKVPYGVVSTSDGRLIVVDTHNNRVQRWDAGATEGVTILGESEGFVQPAAIVLDEDHGFLFVADTGNHAVVRYPWNSSIGNVTGKATVMAGFYGNYSQNLTHLDNPVAMFYESATESVWIADARNFRIIRWPENTDTGVLEVDNLPGRPYGVYVLDGVLYYADADDCVVWKRLRLDNGTYLNTSVAGTPGVCGPQSEELWFPSALIVLEDGTVFIADTINHRVARWDPDPSPATTVCLLSRYCDIEAKNPNPTPGNLVVVVSEESECGGVCYPSGLWGIEWNTTSRPQPPLLRDVTFRLGIAMLGSRGNYKMCWGAAADTSAFDEPDAEGNYDCSFVPMTFGILEMDFFVFEDLDGSRTQCISGAPCWVEVIGYAIPFDVKLVQPPSGDWTGVCGETSQENFLGYRESVDVNPSSYPRYGGYEMPFNSTNFTNETNGTDPRVLRNLTTVINQTFGLASGKGRVPLCLCARGDECTAPYMFTYPAGFMQIRSVMGAERWYCIMDTLCVISVHGAFLKPTDVAMIVSNDDDCGVRPSINASLSFDNATPTVSSFAPALDLGEDYFETTFMLGNATEDRMFKICYCASYDTIDARVDQDEIMCNLLSEFTQSAGILGINHVFPADFECPITHNCTIPIWGVKMMPKTFHPGYGSNRRLHDKLLMEFGSTERICGRTIPLEGVMYDNPNVYDPTMGGNLSYLEFDFGAFTVAGVRAICFCSTFEAKLAYTKGTCNDEDEFYQPVGQMVVRGPINEPIHCIAETECLPNVRGTELSTDDLIQVCPDHSYCGSNVSCPASGPLASEGILETTGSTAAVSSWNVGTMPLGLYALCYCAAGRNGTTFPLNCSAPEHLTMSAGELRVRGSNQDHRFSCVAGNPCRFTVYGFDLSKTDALLIAPLESTCGNTSAVEEGTFYPSSILKAQQGTAALVYRHYHLTHTANPGRFRVCYCVYPSCDEDYKYHLDAGLLFLKGLLNVPDAFFCLMLQNCVIPLEGYGLREDDDAIQILPKNLSCGGIQVIVEGDMNATGVLNGSYMRQSGLVDGRHWYMSSAGQYLFFDVYAQRWIMGPKLDPDIPEVNGYAHAYGRWAKTPDSNIGSDWRRWDPYTLRESGGVTYVGAWVGDPALLVRSSKVPNGTFTEHPSRKTDMRVRDEALGAPYLLEERFHLGIGNQIGAYRICFCPSLDLLDYDDYMCSNDDEYIADVNILVVKVVRGKERYHCADGDDCIIRTVLTVPWPSERNTFAAALLPAGTTCYYATESLPWNNSWKIWGGMVDGELQFNLGNPPRMQAEYTVCVCTDYDDNGDGVPCNQLSEFFQNAGNLTIAPLLRLDFEYGSPVATFNLTRTTGLAPSDRMRFVSGDDCSVISSGLLSEVGKPNEMGGEVWAAYPLGSQESGGVQLDRGLYSACLCANYDGPDSDEEACNDPDEFLARVGLIFVMVIKNPMSVSSVEAAMVLSVTKFVIATAATPLFTPFRGGRRLQAKTPERVASRPFGLIRDIEFATVIADVLHQTITQALSTSLDSVILNVNDLVRLSSRRSETEDGEPIEVVRIGVNFTASLHGDSEQHIISGAACSGAVLDDPYDPVPLKCLMLAQVLSQRSAMLLNLNNRFGSSGLPGIAEISVLELQALSVSPDTDGNDEYYDQVCARGLPCNVSVVSNGLLTGLDKLLIGPGTDGTGAFYCGPTSLYPGGMLAVDRGVAAFPQNPVEVPGDNAALQAASLTFITGSPKDAGVFNMCYCWASGGAPCIYNREFYQTTGVLTVRGPYVHERVPCIANARCLPLIEGVELSSWDRIVAIRKDGTCGSTSPADAFVDGFQFNPAAAEASDAYSEAFPSRRLFDFGTVIRVGEFRICYCVSSARTSTHQPVRTCETPADFASTAGTLKIRGISMGEAVYTCSKSDYSATPCDLKVSGYGILPEIDALYLSPIMDKPCNALPKKLLVDATGKSNGITPNPMQLTPLGKLETWAYTDKRILEDRQYTDEATATLQIASAHGTYRVCACAAAADPAGTYTGGCESGRDFFNQIGSIEIRGVGDRQLFLCEEGLPCSVTLAGVHLSLQDRLEIIGPAEACGRPFNELSKAIERNRLGPSEVSGDETRAVYDLGHIKKNPREQTVTFRICYCANYDGSDDGSCSNSSEFTHTGGFINTVICPEAQVEEKFTPPIEDIFGDPGDPRVELYMVPSFTCLEAEEEDKNLGFTERQRLGSKFPLDKQQTFNYSVIITSMPGRCDPGIPVKQARMNMLELGTLDLMLVGGPGGDNLQVGRGYELQGQAHVVDLINNQYSCPKWKVQMVPFGCSWLASVWFGILLHGVFLLSATLIYMQNRVYRVVRWLRFLKAMRPQTRGNLGAKQAKLQAIKDAEELKLHSNAKYYEWQLQVKKDLAAGGELKGDTDRSLVAMLASRKLALLGALLKTGAVFSHVVMLWLNFPDWVTMLVVPAGAALLVLLGQLFLMVASRGCRTTCKTGLPLQPLLHSIAAASKVHFDLVLPMLARRHHCEVWRVAIVACVGVVTIQVLVPVGSLLASLLPPRRHVPEHMVPYAASMMEPKPVARREMLSKEEAKRVQRRHSLNFQQHAIQDAIKEAPEEKEQEESAIPTGFRTLRLGSKQLQDSSDSDGSPVTNSRTYRSGHRESSKEASARMSVESSGRAAAMGWDSPPKSSKRSSSTDGFTRGSAQDRERPSPITVTPVSSPKASAQYMKYTSAFLASCRSSCTDAFSEFLRQVKLCYWNYRVLVSERVWGDPEELLQNRLVSAYTFLEASGWYASNKLIKDTVEHITGVCLIKVEGHWSMLTVLSGGVDLTAMHALFLIGYMTRLSPVEVIVLAIAIVIGVLFMGRPGNVQAFLDFSTQFIQGPYSFVAVMLMVGLVRFLASSALSHGCPFYTWAFSGWCISVLVVEVPLFLFWLHRQQAREEEEEGRETKPPWWKRSALFSWLSSGFSRKPRQPSSSPESFAANGRSQAAVSEEVRPEDSKAPVHSPLGRLPGPKFPGFAVAAPVFIEETEEPHPGDHLPERLNMVNGRSVSRDELMRLIEGPPPWQESEIGLEERLAQLKYAEKALTLMDGDLLRNPVWRFQLEELQVLANNEFRKLQLAARAVNLTRTKHFSLGSLYNRTQLSLEVLPEAPMLRLVHWNTIVKIERLPMVDEHHYLSSALEVWQRLKAKAVVVAVIHRWRGYDDPDPLGITARQLVVFALWYRERWGKDLELFYWIDVSCMPKEVPKEEKERRNSSKDWSVGPHSEDLDQAGMPNLDPSMSLHHLTHVAEHLKEIDEEREVLRRESMFEAGPSCLAGAAHYNDYDVMQESSDAFLPLVYACSDAVVVCEAKDSETRAWVHLEMALAYAFAPTGNKMYSVDQKLGIRRRPRKKSVPTGSPSPAMPAGDFKGALFGGQDGEAITDLVHPDLGSIFRKDPEQDVLAITDGHANGNNARAAGSFISHESNISAIEDDPEARHETAEEQALALPASQSNALALPSSEPENTLAVQSSSNSALVRLPTGAVHIKEDEANSEHSDPDATVKKFAQEAFFRTKAKFEVKTLANPLRWDHALEGDKERIARLLYVCMTEPTIAAAGGYRRRQINFHPTPSIIHVTRLEGLSRSRKTRQERVLKIDRGTVANAAMLSSMGVPEAVAKNTLGWAETEEDRFEKDDHEDDLLSEGLSSETASSLPTQLELPGPKAVRMDRNERPTSPNSTRVFAHVRKRLDWEERTMDLYYHHRWNKKDNPLLNPISRATPAQILVDEAAKADLSSEGEGSFDRPWSKGSDRPWSKGSSRASAGNGERPSTAASWNTDRPSSAQSWITERPSTAKSNRSEGLDAYDPSDEPPLLQATRNKIAWKNRPFGGETKEVPRQETAAENLLRRAASGKASTTQSRAKQPLSYYSPEKRIEEELFHPDFRPSTVLLGDGGLTVMQLRANNPTGGLVGNKNKGKIVVSPLGAGDACLPSGGMAVTMHQLPARRGVAPEEADVRGVCFEVIVETVDNRWSDGLGIGFTAQDPDRWNRKKPQPRHASGMPKTWVCGYSGRWVLNGRSEMIRPLRGGHVKAWQPGTLQVGDIVTAVAAPPPADVFRILVNGKVVAERPLRNTGLVDPAEVPLWGVVDVDGACVSVRLRTGTAFGERPKSANSVVSTRSRSEPRTLLGSTVPLGLRAGTLIGPDRKRPATSDSFRSQERKRPATSESMVRSMSSRGNRAVASSLARSGLEERPGTAPTLTSGSQRPGTAPASSMFVSKGFYL